MIGLLLSLAAPAEPPVVFTLAQCEFTPVIGTTAQPIPFALLFEAPGPGQLQVRSARVHDPKKLIQGLPITGGVYTEGRRTLWFDTDGSLPVGFRIAFSPGRAGKDWLGTIGMNQVKTAQEYLSSSYIADCTISAPADAAARFEAMEAGR